MVNNNPNCFAEPPRRDPSEEAVAERAHGHRAPADDARRGGGRHLRRGQAPGGDRALRGARRGLGDGRRAPPEVAPGPQAPRTHLPETTGTSPGSVLHYSALYEGFRPGTKRRGLNSLQFMSSYVEPLKVRTTAFSWFMAYNI